LVVDKHLKRYSNTNIEQFKVVEQITSTSDEQVKLTYNYRFKNASFSVLIVINHTSVETFYNIDGQNLTDEIFEISKFLKHFDTISKDDIQYIYNSFKINSIK
jgi:hypothetical protein